MGKEILKEALLGTGVECPVIFRKTYRRREKEKVPLFEDGATCNKSGEGKERRGEEDQLYEQLKPQDFSQITMFYAFQ